jgi:hypothetical protein
MSTTTHQATDGQPIEDRPPALDPYWPSRIEDDRIWYSHHVLPDSRFVCHETDAVFRIRNIGHGGDTFTLSACYEADGLSDGFKDPDTGDHFVDNICDLAGAIEAGELTPLPSGVMKTVGGTTYFTVGDLTIEIDADATDGTPLLEQLDPPNGPISTDIAKIAPILEEATTDPTLYGPQEANSTSQKPASGSNHDYPEIQPRGAQDVPTHFVPVQPFSKWTFEDSTIRHWVESTFEEGETILNACAGQTELTPPPGGKILRNDISGERPNLDFEMDVAELAGHPDLEEGSIDRVVFDPPWSLYQANLRYQKNMVSNSKTHEIDLTALPFETPGPDEKTQIGHSRLAKEGFDWLLSSGGEVVEITFHGTSMPARLGYERKQRVLFDPLGEAKAVIGSVDQKVRRSLSDFF